MVSFKKKAILLLKTCAIWLIKRRSAAMKNKRKRLAGIDYSKTLIATVDISKAKHSGYYRCPDGTDIKSFEFFTFKLVSSPGLLYERSS